MTKKEEVLTFLDLNFFYPILSSSIASEELKCDFKYMSTTIKRFSVEGILIYFWTIMTNSEIELIFTYRLEDEGLLDFTSFINEFKGYFTYEWLCS